MAVSKNQNNKKKKTIYDKKKNKIKSTKIQLMLTSFRAVGGGGARFSPTILYLIIHSFGVMS